MEEKLKEISQNRNIRVSTSVKQTDKKQKKGRPVQGVGKLDKIGEEMEEDDGYTTPPEPESPPRKASTPAAATMLPASQQPQIPDLIEDKIRQTQLKGTKPIASGVIRGVKSLGAWAGGSLLATLRVRGAVEVDRDTFLAQGLAGARKGGDGDRAGAQAGGRGAGTEREKAVWNLGGWA